MRNGENKRRNLIVVGYGENFAGEVQLNKERKEIRVKYIEKSYWKRQVCFIHCEEKFIE